MADSVLTELTMYGLCLKPGLNSCDVIKADVVIGKRTTLSKGQNKGETATPLSTTYTILG